MYENFAILGRREIKVRHFPVQNQDKVMCYFSRLHYTKILNIIMQKMRSVFAILGIFQGISPDFPPQNGHPSCRLGFDSSNVEARREAGTPLYNVLITHNILEKDRERFGWFWGEPGPFWVKNRHSQIA